MADWIWALIAGFAGLIVGAIAARGVRTFMSKPRRPDVVRQAAAPTASLVFSILLVAGLVTALGLVNEEALDDIPNDLVDFLPEALSALIVIIVGNVVATLAATAVEGALSRSDSRTRRIVPRLVRVVILGFAIILAAAQLGIDTTIINITVAALLFSIGAGAALMIGLGSRDIATEVAAGRALRRLLRPGDRLTIEGLTGEVVEVQSVAVEVRSDDGHHVIVPNSELLSDRITIERSQPSRADEPFE